MYKHDWRVPFGRFCGDVVVNESISIPEYVNLLAAQGSLACSGPAS